MKYSTLLAAVSVLVMASGCSDDTSTPVTPDPPTNDEITISNCEILRDALEAFAAENGATYPQWETIASPFGNTLLDYLPNNEVPLNPYTGKPVLGGDGFPFQPGDISYEPFADVLGGGRPAVGYRLQAFGSAGSLITLQNVTSVSADVLDAQAFVLESNETLVVALEAFYDEAGHFPSDVGGDETPSGKTLVDFLPGGNLLWHPYYEINANPQEGSPGDICGIGYRGLTTGTGTVYAYLIETWGSVGALRMRLPGFPRDPGALQAYHVTLDLVREFAEANGGVYPRDVDTDETPAGLTILEMLAPYEHHSWYDSQPIWPLNEPANAVDEVGYVPVLDGENVVGFVINAWGLQNEIARYASPIAQPRR